MRRTEILQEIRKMRFEEAYGVWTEGRLTQEGAARMLGVCAGMTMDILQSTDPERTQFVQLHRSTSHPS